MVYKQWVLHISILGLLSSSVWPIQAGFDYKLRYVGKDIKAANVIQPGAGRKTSDADAPNPKRWYERSLLKDYSPEWYAWLTRNDIELSRKFIIPLSLLVLTISTRDRHVEDLRNVYDTIDLPINMAIDGVRSAVIAQLSMKSALRICNVMGIESWWKSILCSIPLAMAAEVVLDRSFSWVEEKIYGLHPED